MRRMLSATRVALENMKHTAPLERFMGGSVLHQQSSLSDHDFEKLVSRRKDVTYSCDHCKTEGLTALQLIDHLNSSAHLDQVQPSNENSAFYRAAHAQMMVRWLPNTPKKT
eukprot:TRINITY_DN10753_c0_g3_i1.p1 TRINITY_DN10753_c0_g3~~TRINITY_DN10753_c0_g3_i1.p1  ORF type:complete len:130 (+),score=10.55 TRINITY_DN10753_c0_g3_i1:60-392(+)